VTDPDAFSVDLDAGERRLLSSGMLEWGGPARCTEEMAIALGFESVQDIFDQTDRLRGALASGAPLTYIDWSRVVLATEVVFASAVVGSGHDWSITTGITDADTIVLLRQVQMKVTRAAGRRLGNGIGNRSGPAPTP
jgi:hypothetical protein